jgi:Spy/CpxP family protein refolding chaperone
VRLFFSGVVIAIAATAGAPSFAQAPAAGEATGTQGMGRHHGHHGMGRHGGEAGAPRHMERMLDRIGASEAQRAQIQQLRQAAAPDVKAQREAGRALREQQRQVLSAATIDTNRAEQLRMQMVEHHDKTSRRRTQLMIDVAQVLTPEQRTQLGTMMAQRGSRGHGEMKRGQRGPMSDAPRS